MPKTVKKAAAEKSEVEPKVEPKAAPKKKTESDWYTPLDHPGVKPASARRGGGIKAER